MEAVQRAVLDVLVKRQLTGLTMADAPVKKGSTS
jgi:hypothetical protein